MHIPVLSAHYSLELPPGWEYVTKWANHPEIKPVQNGSRVQWDLSDVKEIRKEEDMPPLRGIAGQMIIYFIPPGQTVAMPFPTGRRWGTGTAR